MDDAKLKVVQTELKAKIYEVFKEVSKEKGMTIKEATRESISEWTIQNSDIRKDPLFDLSNVIKGGKKTDSSKIDEVLYVSKKEIE